MIMTSGSLECWELYMWNHPQMAELYIERLRVVKYDNSARYSICLLKKKRFLSDCTSDFFTQWPCNRNRFIGGTHHMLPSGKLT